MPTKCKFLEYFWSCERTTEIIDGETWMQPCEYYPDCEKCSLFESPNKKRLRHDYKKQF